MYTGIYIDSNIILMSTKIQKLFINWPQGLVRTVSGLKKEGFSQSLINHYRLSGWFESIGDGALIKAGDTPSVFGAVYALQQDLNLNVHIGSISAIELMGYNHNVPLAKKTHLYLFGEQKRLPKWFASYDWNANIYYSSTKFFKNPTNVGLIKHEGEIMPLVISDRTRSMIEFLDKVGRGFSVEHAKNLMDSLGDLIPGRVNTLLQECKSIKIKRLFLLLAEYHHHTWVKKIDYDKIDLGVGPRNLTPNGKFHKKYKITLPKTVLMEF